MKLGKPFSRLFSSSSVSSASKRPSISKDTLSIDSAKQLHAHLITTHLSPDPNCISPVLKSYALSSSHLHKAHLIFNQFERPTLLIWNHMIHGYSISDFPYKAIDFYNKMHFLGFSGNSLTFIFIFKACARNLDKFHGGKFQVHALKIGYWSYLFVGNSVIHMYGSWGDMGSARKVFDEMPERDLVSWNSLICGYSQCNRHEEVLALFCAMKEANLKADAVTLVKVVLACNYTGDYDFADSVVKYIDENRIVVDVYLGNTLIDMYGRRGMVNLARKVFDSMRERNLVSWNALVISYAKAGDLVESRKLFDRMPQRDVISWTSMITGYCQRKNFAEALSLFQEMMAANVVPDEITVACVLSACAHLGSLDVGVAVHDYISRHDIKADVYVGNTLIDMYCKCGAIEKALEVFNKMGEKDSVSWTSVISGLAVNGFANSAIQLFSRMLIEGFRPTHGAFVGVLLACSHAGLVDKGLKYFKSMEKVYGLIPEMKHFGCVVDLLSRYGHLDRAYQFITTMPIDPDIVLWRILLSACKLHGNVALAEIAANKLLELDCSNSGNYVLLSDTYAASDRWDDAKKLRELMVGSNVQKPSGWSLIEVNRAT